MISERGKSEPDTIAKREAAYAGEAEEIAFLVNANDSIAAEVYENMLIENGIHVVKKQCEPYVQGFVYLDYAKCGVNIYVPKDKLEAARELLDSFESESYSYNIPMEEYQRRLRRKPSVIGFIILSVIFGAPIVSAIAVIIYHLFIKK